MAFLERFANWIELAFQNPDFFVYVYVKIKSFVANKIYPYT